MRQIGGTLIVVRYDCEKAFMMVVGEFEGQRSRRGRRGGICVGERAVGVGKVGGGGRRDFVGGIV